MRDHRSLKAWQEARQVTVLVIRASHSLWRPWAGALFQQLQRASLSVQLNIAEGASFGASATYRRHLGIAYGSAIETGELIELLGDVQVVPQPIAEELLTHSRNCQRLLLGLLKRHRPMTAQETP